MKKYMILVIALVFMLTGCTPTAEVTPTPEPTPTEIVTPTPEPVPTETPVPGALTAEELQWFEDVFFYSTITNIRNVFGSPFGCTYADARDIDLAQLFGDSCLLQASEEEIRLLVRQGAFPELRDEMSGDEGGYICPVFCLTRSDMDKTLEKYTGLSLRMTNQVGLDKLPYLEEYDAYYWCFGDAGYPGPVTILSGVRNGSSVRLYLQGPEDTIYRLILEQQPEGNYRFVSNVPIPDDDQVPIPEDPADAESTRYFFADGYFLGSWSDGTWHSCSESEDNFTVGEIFNRDYYDVFGDRFHSVRFYVGMADNNPRGGFAGTEFLEPFGIIEGDDFIMKLPGQLAGEAAQVAAPYYNFRASFDGATELISSNVPLEGPSCRYAENLLPEETLTQVLADAGIRCDLARTDRFAWELDMDSDGAEEYLELVRTQRDEDGYMNFGPGEQCFYAIILQDGDQVSVVTSKAISYTTDLTAQFYASDVQCRDLDGDGICEVIFNVTAWEGGGYQALTFADGQWTCVLRSNYGT